MHILIVFFQSVDISFSEEEDQSADVLNVFIVELLNSQVFNAYPRKSLVNPPATKIFPFVNTDIV